MDIGKEIKNQRTLNHWNKRGRNKWGREFVVEEQMGTKNKWGRNKWGRRNLLLNI